MLALISRVHVPDGARVTFARDGKKFHLRRVELKILRVFKFICSLYES